MIDFVHICKENEMFDTIMDSRVYKEDNGWWLSLDCGCCYSEIHYCPYCGMELV